MSMIQPSTVDPPRGIRFIPSILASATARVNDWLIPWMPRQSGNYHGLQRQLADSSKLSLTVLLAFLAVEMTLQDTMTELFAFIATLYTLALRLSFTGLQPREFKRRVCAITFPIFFALSVVPDLGVLVLTCISVARCTSSPVYAVGAILLACLPLLLTKIYPVIGCIRMFTSKGERPILPGPGNASRTSVIGEVEVPIAPGE
ncbi:hypothetical protein OE88DRAFT_1733585 [Heliocybe sulcata]|uniref:Uncharacterized protein n=1 Tax=Heliocybe sulcata TaxID=5364 RepID=A0A5C3NB74_9AGAM|nr:hypothetical protein OE88DRAFT_1733585 [Heliocybe sulcata]